jgi:phosphoenolpyruvate synthase/pyruvate phosphate dikinase
MPDDEVIIQEMVTNTSMSGVIFTHDLNTGAPYYV